eukprot:Pgem_evm1s1474
MRCHGYPYSSELPLVTMTAGQEFTFKTYMQATHVGDCFLYLSVPGENIDSPEKWYKIYENSGCGAASPSSEPPSEQSLTFTIPEGVLATNHGVLRFEWHALQRNDQVEFYVSCADVKVVNDKQTSVKPESIVSINGLEYLKAPDRSDYRLPYQNPSDHHLVGPALAKYITSSSDHHTTSTPVHTTSSSDQPAPVAPGPSSKGCQKPEPVIVEKVVYVTTTVYTHATSYVT